MREMLSSEMLNIIVRPGYMVEDTVTKTDFLFVMGMIRRRNNRGHLVTG